METGTIIETDRGPRIVVDDWQPIETAMPWLWPAHTYVQVIQKNAGGFWMTPWSARWSIHQYWTDRGDMDAPRLYFQPTHWRPLPTPPGYVCAVPAVAPVEPVPKVAPGTDWAVLLFRYLRLSKRS